MLKSAIIIAIIAAIIIGTVKLSIWWIKAHKQHYEDVYESMDDDI
jgi:hypothetical protein